MSISLQIVASKVTCLITVGDYGKGKNVPVYVMKACSRSGGTALLMLNLGSRWQRVVFIFMPRLPYPGYKNKIQYLLQ